MTTEEMLAEALRRVLSRLREMKDSGNHDDMVAWADQMTPGGPFHVLAAYDQARAGQQTWRAPCACGRPKWGFAETCDYCACSKPTGGTP